MRALEQATLDDLVWPGFDAAKGRNYDMSMWALIHSNYALGRNNVGGYQSADATRIADALRTTADMSTRQELVQSLERALAGDVPFIMLYFQDGLFTLTLNFALPRLMPGSPLTNLAGEAACQLTPQEQQRLIRDAGLDVPVFDQYVRYVTNIVRGDLGYSFQRKRPVTAVLIERVPWTLLLSGTALIVSAGIGIAFGSAAGWRRPGSA